MEIEAVLLSSSSWVLLALTLVFLALKYQKPRSKLPPGPKPWPIIGNLHQIGPIPHQSFHSLAAQYGPILHLRFGSSPVVIASSPEMAKQFLKTHDHVFASRPATAAGKLTSYNYCDLTWAPYGPYWRQARKLYLTEIFTPNRLNSFEYIRIEERRAMISRLYAGSRKPTVLRDHLCRHTLTTISRMVLSNKYFSDAKTPEKSSQMFKIEELQRMLDEWFLLNGVLNVGDWIPWLSFLDLQGYVKKMKGLYKKFDRFHNIVLDDHKAKGEVREGEKDMVDVLLKLADDPTLEVKLTSDCVKGLVQDLIAGGTDTSATTVEWAILELLRQPRILQKATEELDRVIGRTRWVEEEDCSHLPFLEAIIKETLRLHPLATLLAPHYSVDDCNVAGYDIPKGTTVFINVWTIGRDPEYWERPEEFRPERFVGKEDLDVKGQSFELLPFGSGRRKCPGISLALKMVRSTLANLVHGFTWRLPKNMTVEEICTEELYGLTTHPKVALAVVLEPRLATHLY